MPKFTEDQIDFMRQDLENNFVLSRFVDTVKTIFKIHIRDFDKEFETWKTEKKGA